MTDQPAIGERVDDDEARYRLPRTVVPRRYDLVLEPDLEAVTFAGSETVTVEVDGAGRRDRAQRGRPGASDPGGSRGPAARSRSRRSAWTRRPSARTCSLSGTAEPGEWTLHLEFRGKLSDQLQGFYRSTYTDDAGVTHTIATTQFESTDARRAFPCWDEPDLKAVFGVTLVAQDGLLAISNGPEIVARAGRATDASGCGSPTRW